MNFEKSNNIHTNEKIDPYLIRSNNSNYNFRATELQPDYDENEILKGNNFIMKNYMDPDFYYSNSNIEKAFMNVYPFNIILQELPVIERKFLYYRYSENLSFTEIGDKLNIPLKKLKRISKNAYIHYVISLKKYATNLVMQGGNK